MLSVLLYFADDNIKIKQSLRATHGGISFLNSRFAQIGRIIMLVVFEARCSDRSCMTSKYCESDSKAQGAVCSLWCCLNRESDVMCGQVW